jgi:molybdopterin molybdotransferase
VLSVEEALSRVLAGIPVLGSESVELTAALGRVLAEPIIAGRELPPWDNSAMDGYAMRSELRARLETPVAHTLGRSPRDGGRSTCRSRQVTISPAPARQADAVISGDVRRDGESSGSRLVPGGLRPPRGEDIRSESGPGPAIGGSTFSAGGLGRAPGARVPATRVAIPRRG